MGDCHDPWGRHGRWLGHPGNISRFVCPQCEVISQIRLNGRLVHWTAMFTTHLQPLQGKNTTVTTHAQLNKKTTLFDYFKLRWIKDQINALWIFLSAFNLGHYFHFKLHCNGSRNNAINMQKKTADNCLIPFFN